MQYLEGRKYVVQGIFLVVALIFLTRLFFMQVLDGTYKLAADKNTLQRIVQTPYRGLIYDRKDQLLVNNTPVYDLMVVPREVKQARLGPVLRAAANSAGRPTGRHAGGQKILPQQAFAYCSEPDFARAWRPFRIS
ncbi:hypothetical protein ACFQT0_25705 [Hymenobacter humi]|uniref:Penicillin-binding protein dimerisation domain-containing protein n=1 Tax=Hymenobacter humi TaxID=1411620 RepID=A0ABW2UBW2_9BACT